MPDLDGQEREEMDLQVLRTRCEMAGMNERLIEMWLGAENRVLGCSPNEAIRAGRLEEVVDTMEAFAAGVAQ